MKNNSKNLRFGIIIGIAGVFLVNSFIYLITKNSVKIAETYISFIPFDFIFQTSYDLLSETPAIVIPSLVAIITISFTIVVLSFNLGKKLPDKIIDKYILYHKIRWIYLATLTMFIIFSLLIIFSNFYNIYWAYVFIFDLVLSIAMTLVFFTWFLGRIHKKGIYNEIIKNFSKKIKSPKKDNEIIEVDYYAAIASKLFWIS